MKGTNLYLIKLRSVGEDFFKIGTTVHKYCRFYEIMKSKYEIEIVFMVLQLDNYKAWDAEKYLQSKFDSYVPKKRFGGYTECFKNIDVDNYINLTNNYLKQSYDYISNLEITWR